MSATSQSNKGVSPSRIYPLAPECCNMLSSLSKQYVHNNDRDQALPCNGDRMKLQVVEKSGCWFAVNSAQLAVYRELEVKGRCSRVVIDVLPCSHVPSEVMNMIQLPSTAVDKEANITCSTGEITNGSAPPAVTSGLQNGFPTDTDESATDSSNCADTDSEFDWSHDEPETSDMNEESDSDSETLLETAV